MRNPKKQEGSQQNVALLFCSRSEALLTLLPPLSAPQLQLLLRLGEGAAGGVAPHEEHVQT